MGNCCGKNNKPSKSLITAEAKNEPVEAAPSGDFLSLGSLYGSGVGTDGDNLSPLSSTKSIYDAFMQKEKHKILEEDPGHLVTMPHDPLTWVRDITPPRPPERYPYYVTTPVESMHLKLFMEVMQLLLDEGMFYTSKEGKRKPPFSFHAPEELHSLMDFSLPAFPVSHAKFLDIIRGIIKYQPHISHPLFMEQRIAGLEPYSIMADMIATVANSNNVMYILSTVTTLLEVELLHTICHTVGYDYQEGDSEGVITPGATLANGYAMRLAVKQKFGHLKHNGLFGCKRPCFYVAEGSSYTHLKCAIFQGFGMDSVVTIKEDDHGRMSMEDLRAKVAASHDAGHVPCMVIGTAGNNVLRAIDHLDQIAEFCREHQMWFHCDATFGGGFLLSHRLRSRLRGVDRSDSFTWSQHFVLGIPPTCTVLVVAPKHKGKLGQYLGLGEGASYGFMKTPLYDPRYDIGHNTILSCRRSEIVKFWFLWKAKGTHGLGKHMEHICENAKYCLHLVKSRVGFEPILHDFEGTNICFYYVPTPYRTLDKNSPEFREKVSLISVGIRRVLLKKGLACMSYCEFKKHPTFLVLGLHNSAVTKPDILYVLNMVQYCGEALSNTGHEKHSHFHELIVRAKHVPG